jgi:ferredoxin
MKKKVDIKTDDCIGCGICIDICPGVFDCDESETKAVVRNRGVENEECIEEAMETCPAQCISWSYDKCKSCETCLILCSEVFSLDENVDTNENMLPDGDIDVLEETIEPHPAECVIRGDR